MLKCFKAEFVTNYCNSTRVYSLVNTILVIMRHLVTLLSILKGSSLWILVSCIS